MVKRADLPDIAQPMHAYSSQVSEETREYVRGLLARNQESLAAMRVAAGRASGSCAQCGTEGLLYRLEPTDPESPMVCPRCSRAAAKGVVRKQLCDNDPEHGPAWRNPYTRRNEYLCGKCHVASGEGVVLNKWAPRESTPLAVQKRAVCEAKNVPGTKPCQGEVKPRGAQGALLCNGHAGKQSAAGDYFD